MRSAPKSPTRLVCAAKSGCLQSPPDGKRLLLMRFRSGRPPEPVIFPLGQSEGKPAPTALGLWKGSPGDKRRGTGVGTSRENAQFGIPCLSQQSKETKPLQDNRHQLQRELCQRVDHFHKPYDRREKQLNRQAETSELAQDRRHRYCQAAD
jgi:hypothetical protein